MTIFFTDWQSEKEVASIFSTEFGIMMDDNLAHPPKALYPIFFKEFGNEIELKLQ